MTTATTSARAATRAVARTASLRRAFVLTLIGAVAVTVAGVVGIFPATDAPAWVGLLVVAVAGIPSVVSVHWWRNRPIAPGEVLAYRKIVSLRIGIALIPLAAALGMLVMTGSMWVFLLGASLTAAGLGSTVPSDADLDRHLSLWHEVWALPPEHLWGTAPADAIAPWDDPEGGHNHGPHGGH